MTPVLSIEALSAGYGGRMILQDVSLQVHPGEIMTIIGHNGAGKSTLLRAIFNLVPARTGRVLLAQRDVWGLPSDRLLMAGIAYIPQHRSVFPRLTIEENLQMGAIWFGIGPSWPNASIECLICSRYSKRVRDSLPA